MSKMKKIAAMTAALLISASTMGYLPQDSIKISNVTANAAEEEITSVEINAENFPDKIFRNYVKENFDTDGDSVLSDKEIAAVTKIDVYDMGISDLTGIEYFENLAILECMFNKLTTLDISKNTALIELNCYHNQLTSLDVSNNTALEQLYCTNNQLTSINVSNNIELKDLRCNDNQLEIIDVSSCPALTRFECNSNQLTSLDLSNNTALKRLTTDENEYEIALTDNTFDLSTLPTGFDISKTSEWTNATVKGNILTIEDVTKAVTYKYDFGNEHSEVFTLVPPKAETPATTTTAANTTNPTTTTTTFATPSYSWHLNVYPYDKADTIYEIGEELDYSTICVYGYGGGENFHADIPYISLDRCNLTVDASEFDNTKPGTYTIYVKWYDAVDSFDVTVIDPDNPTAIPGVEINETNFPDPVFRQYLAKNFDKNTDGRLSDKEIADVTVLHLGELGISDLTGLQYFKNLQTLSCSYNDLTQLDISENKALTHLYCENNNLTTLDTSNNVLLSVLDCHNNKLTKLDFSNNPELKAVWCCDNQLTSLDVSHNTLLSDLACSNNQLASIDLSNTICKEISDWGLLLYGNNHRIKITDNTFDLSTLPTGFDISKASEWTNATVEGNILTIEDITKKVTYTYDCGLGFSETFTFVPYNDASEMDVEINEITFPDAIFRKYIEENFDKDGNKILSYDELVKATFMEIKGLEVSDMTGLQHFFNLQHLYCSNNRITSLDVSNNTALTYLNCSENQLTSLDVSNNAKLDTLTCLENQLTSLDLSNNPALTSFSCDDNKYKIALTNNTFDLSTLPGGFDISKASDWKNATVKDNILTVIDDTALITYSYKCGEEVVCFNLFTSNYVGETFEEIEIDNNNFPDDVFRRYVAEKFDENNDLALSYDEVMNVTYISLNESNLYDLTGIQYFKNLSSLWCYDNNLTTLDVSNNTELKILACSNNQLTSLDVSHNTLLTDLMCSNNQLASVDLSNTNCLEGWEFGVELNNNKHRIKITDNTFDLSTLPTGFDISKASEWTNATVKGNILTIEDITKKVTYTYNCGLGFSETFTFVPYNDASEMDVEINEITFPDAIFRKYIEENFDKDGNKILSYDELVKATFMKINGLEVSDMTGLQHFFNLQTLYCSNNRITSLDVSNNTELEVLSCYNNQITSLDVSNNAKLCILTCLENQLTSLDLSNNPALTSFSCDDNKYKIALTNNTFDLSTLPGGFDISKASDWKNATVKDNILTVIDDTALITYSYKCGEEVVCFNLFTSNYVGETFEEIEIDNNNFPDDVFRRYVAEKFDENNDWALSYDEVMNVTNISLDESNLYDLTGIQYFKNLSSLWCYDNNLTTLDISENTALKILVCDYNELTSLDVSNNTALKRLYFDNNQLTSINVSNNIELKDLRCNDNQLEIIDVSNCSALTYLDCDVNQLTSLDVSNTKVQSTSAYQNKYEIHLTNKTFDLSTLPAGFDVSKASNWTNGTVDGNILTVEDITKEITYKYDCGKKQTLTFTLIPQIEETPVETTIATTTAETTTTTAAPETTTTVTTTVTTTPATTTPEEDLPQTGFSKLYNCIPVSAGALVLLGMYAVKKSKKEDEE